MIINVVGDRAVVEIKHNGSTLSNIWVRTDYGAKQRTCKATKEYNEWLDTLEEIEG